MYVVRSSTAIFASGSVDILKFGAVKIGLALVHEVAAECGKSVLEAKLRLTTVKSEYLRKGSIPTILDIYLRKISS